jgi:hypothetical protein
MNTIERSPSPAAVRRLCAFAMVAILAALGASPAIADVQDPQSSLEQWLLRRLNEPTARELAHEHQGNVYVYDGLTDREVDQAMNRHFERIQYMMFVGTRKTAPEQAAPGRTAPAASDDATESPGCGP